MPSTRLKVNYFLLLILFFNNFLLFSSKEIKASVVTDSPVLLTKNSFTPTIISSDIEIGNSQRGYYMWNTTAFLSSLPEFDTYDRFSWKQIEISKDVYDFSIIDTKLAALKAGQRFSFRIMPLNTCCSQYKNGAEVPDYIVKEKLGWYYSHAYAGSDSIFVPDWNDPKLLNRMEKLVEALGKRYDNDPRISFVEIGLYGNWGEWHCYPIEYPNALGHYEHPNPTHPYLFAPIMKDPQDTTRQKYREGSFKSKKRIFYSYVKAFPHTQLISLTSDIATLSQFLSIKTEKPIGLRRDSWGDPSFTILNAYQKYKPTAAEWNIINNRWKIAPFFAENWGGSFTDDKDMVKQLELLHISGIAFGNFGSDWSQLDKKKQVSYLKCGRRVGYRYQISKVDVQVKNSILDLTTVWKNVNIAPSYDKWIVQAYVVEPETGKLFSSIVNIPIDLKLLLDSSTAPIQSSISLKLNAGWKKGKDLQVRLIVKDHANYLLPMNLDMTNRNTDGSYNLFPISVLTGIDTP
ncbi:MAG: DUF4832 domain-containing protein [Paludibacter sp.]